MSENIGASIVFPASLAGARRGAGGGEWIFRSTRREVLISNARKGVRWKLRVANLSPLAPRSGGADLRHLLRSPCRLMLYSPSPASLLGERSPLHSALALQREESFKNPQKREFWRGGGAAFTPRRPKPRKNCSFPDPSRVARLCGPSVWLSASPTRTRQGSLVSGFSPSLGAQKAILKKKNNQKNRLCLCRPCADTPGPPGPAPPVRYSFLPRFGRA